MEEKGTKKGAFLTLGLEMEIVIGDYCGLIFGTPTFIEINFNLDLFLLLFQLSSNGNWKLSDEEEEGLGDCVLIKKTRGMSGKC